MASMIVLASVLLASQDLPISRAAAGSRKWSADLACPSLVATQQLCLPYTPECGIHLGLSEEYTAANNVMRGLQQRVSEAINLLVVRSQFRQGDLILELGLEVLATLERLSCVMKYGEHMIENMHVYVGHHCDILSTAIRRLEEATSLSLPADSQQACQPWVLSAFLEAADVSIVWVVRVLGLEIPNSTAVVPQSKAESSRLRYPASLVPPGVCDYDAPPTLGGLVLEPRFVSVGEWGPREGLPVYVAELMPRLFLNHIVDAGIILSHWIIDIGAQGVHKLPLGQLVHDGSAAMLVEGDVEKARDSTFSGHLREAFGNRKDVCIINRFLEPVHLQATWQECIAGCQDLLRLDGTPVAPRDGTIDWLKIDVDNGGCDFLEAALNGKLRPLVVQLEIRPYPPPLRYRQPFRKEDACPYSEANAEVDWQGTACLITRDCSMAAAMDILRPHGYIAVPHDIFEGDAHFLRRDVAEKIAPHLLQDDLEVAWRRRWCSMSRRACQAAELLHFDERLWLDPATSEVEKQALLRDYFAKHFPTWVNATLDP
eukprot:TRINITY_DN94454_c0_g1_i1.p1 TRINITY_DN94454_c0_g1~~TRINITY_DN94454_c0_g1_i1.p1  ORF type:complete len:543 (+),score=88.37 TRINITY_DN94454_c0_g1_i1:21-1649(+)